MAYTVYGVSSGTVPTEAVQAELNAITTEYFQKALKQVVYEKCAYLKIMNSKHKIKIKGGTQLSWRVRVKKLGTAGSVDPRASVGWESAETRKAVNLNWKFYWGSTFATWDEILMNKGSKAQLVDLVADKTTELTEDLDDQLATALFATSASDSDKDIVPLNEAIGESTYAGLDPTTLDDSTRWKSQVDSTATEVYLWPDDNKDGKSLSEMITSARFGTDGPTIILVEEDIFNTIEGYFDARQRISDEGILKIGFDNIKFKNIPIVAEKEMPSGYIFGIDEKAVNLMVHPDYDRRDTDWKPHEDYPNALYKGISWAGNVQAKYRHTCFKFSNLS